MTAAQEAYEWDLEQDRQVKLEVERLVDHVELDWLYHNGAACTRCDMNAVEVWREDCLVFHRTTGRELPARRELPRREFPPPPCRAMTLLAWRHSPRGECYACVLEQQLLFKQRALEQPLRVYVLLRSRPAPQGQWWRLRPQRRRCENRGWQRKRLRPQRSSCENRGWQRKWLRPQWSSCENRGFKRKRLPHPRKKTRSWSRLSSVGTPTDDDFNTVFSWVDTVDAYMSCEEVPLVRTRSLVRTRCVWRQDTYLFRHDASGRWVFSHDSPSNLPPVIDKYYDSTDEDDLDACTTIRAPHGPLPLGERGWRYTGEGDRQARAAGVRRWGVEPGKLSSLLT